MCIKKMSGDVTNPIHWRNILLLSQFFNLLKGEIFVLLRIIYLPATAVN